jgi:hypothetical protein
MVTVIGECKQVTDAIIPREVTQWLPNLPRPCIWLQAVKYDTHRFKACRKNNRKNQNFPQRLQTKS